MVYWTVCFESHNYPALSNDKIWLFCNRLTLIKHNGLIWGITEYLCLSLEEIQRKLLPSSCIIHLKLRVISTEQCLSYNWSPSGTAQKASDGLFSWLCMGDWTYQYNTVSSYERQGQPSKAQHRAAPHYSRAAGQAVRFHPTYHRDNAALCKAQRSKTTPMRLVRRIAGGSLITVGILVSLLQRGETEKAFKTKLWACAT